MQRLVGRHIAPEMLGLVFLEAAISFALGFAVIWPGTDTSAVVAADHAALGAACIGGISFLLGLYRPQAFMRVRTLLLNTALGGAIAFPAAWAAGALVGMDPDWIVGHDPVWPVKILLTWILALFAVRLAFLLAVRSHLFVRPVAVVGAHAAVAGTIAAIRSGRAGFFQVAMPLAAQGGPAALRAAGIRNAVICVRDMAGMPASDRAAFVQAGVELESEPEFWERHLKRVAVDHLSPAWFAALDRQPTGRLHRMFNRAGDVSISLGLLLFTLPLMLLVALLVRLDSAGPVLYRQERVGLGGRPFVLLKFRSMRPDAEARGPAWRSSGMTQGHPRRRFHAPDADRRVAAADQCPARRDGVHRATAGAPVLRGAACRGHPALSRTNPGEAGPDRVGPGQLPLWRVGGGCTGKALLRPVLREAPKPAPGPDAPVRDRAGDPVPGRVAVAA